MTLDEHRPVHLDAISAKASSGLTGEAIRSQTDEAIRLLESWLYDPTDSVDEANRDLERLIRSMNRRLDMPDSILQSALWGRLMAGSLSAISAGVLFLDQTYAAVSAGLAIVGAALAVASKVREWLRTNQST